MWRHLSKRPLCIESDWLINAHFWVLTAPQKWTLFRFHKKLMHENEIVHFVICRIWNFVMHQPFSHFRLSDRRMNTENHVEIHFTNNTFVMGGGAFLHERKYSHTSFIIFCAEISPKTPNRMKGKHQLKLWFAKKLFALVSVIILFTFYYR